MPKLRPLTTVQQREAAEAAQRERTRVIIKGAMAAEGYGSYQQLARVTGIGHQILCRRLREGGLRMEEFARIADALRLDPVSRAAVCGGKEKCRFEAGYKGGAA